MSAEKRASQETLDGSSEGFFPLRDLGSYELSSGTVAQMTLCKLFVKMPHRLDLGDNFGTHQTLAFTCRRSADSHMHKSKQLVDCDSTPNADKVTMYDKGYIVSKKRISYLFKNRQLKRPF